MLISSYFVNKPTERLFIRCFFIIWNIQTVLFWKGLHHFLTPDFQVEFYSSFVYILFLPHLSVLFS